MASKINKDIQQVFHHHHKVIKIFGLRCHETAYSIQLPYWFTNNYLPLENHNTFLKISLFI